MPYCIFIGGQYQYNTRFYGENYILRTNFYLHQVFITACNTSKLFKHLTQSVRIKKHRRISFSDSIAFIPRKCHAFDNSHKNSSNTGEGKI